MYAMMTGLIHIFGFLSLIPFTLSFTTPDNRELLFKVLEAVERGAEFFAQDYSDLNVDGLYGLRVAEGQIVATIENCERNGCSEEISDRLVRLLRVVSRTGESAMPYIKEKSPDYFTRFISVIDKPYLLDYKPQRFGDVDDVKIGTQTQYDEEMGDTCYSRLIGSYVENDRKLPRCSSTDKCWDFMTRENTHGYTITHQLLYFILMEHLGCDNVFDQYEPIARPQEVINRFCKTIYKESIMFAKGGKVSRSHQDLFLEQTLLCGTIGYEDFQRTDWMHMVLKWQRSDGCFGGHRKMEMAPMVPRYRRTLLRETPMKDGCLAHKSGLGFGVLATYLRYLVH